MAQQDQPDHSPWYQPRTAEIIQRGGEGFASSMGQGIANFAQGIAQGLEKHKEEQKRIQTLGKSAESSYKSSPDLQKALGMTPEQFSNLSATDKYTAVHGAIEAQGYERGAMETKAAMQRVAQQEQSMNADAAFGRDVSGAFGRNIVQTLAQGNGPVNPPALSYQQIAGGLSPEAWQSKRADPLLNYHLLDGAQAQDPYRAMNAEANMLNAKANYSRATAVPKTGGDYPDVPGYAKVPDGKGGIRYLPNKPSAQETLQIERLSNQRANILQQIAGYDAELKNDNAKSGWDKWPGGKNYKTLKKEAEDELDDINARLNGLKRGQSAPAAKPGSSGSLWEDFNRSIQ